MHIPYAYKMTVTTALREALNEGISREGSENFGRAPRDVSRKLAFLMYLHREVREFTPVWPKGE